MDEYALSDFLVLSVTLRTTYLNIVGGGPGSTDDLNEIVGDLSALTLVIVQLTEQTGPPALPVELVKTEVFEDILTLLMQIAFVLSQSGTDVTSLQEQLRSLHTNLGESFDDMIYQTLATEILMQQVNNFPESLEWKDRFDDLDATTRNQLNSIDTQVRQFADLASSPEKKDFSELLHMVFFDCYLGFQQDSKADRAYAYDYLIREPYQRRFRKHKTYRPTNEKILCSYSSVLDFPIRLNNRWLNELIKEISIDVGAAHNREVVLHEIGEFLQGVDYALQQGQSADLSTKIRESPDLLKAILGYIKITGYGGDLTSKFDIENEDRDRKYDLIDLLNRTIKTPPVVGGAAATGAEMLLTHEEKQVYLLMPFIPQRLISELSPELQLLWYADDGTHQLKICHPEDLPEMVNHPEIHNFVIEFAQERDIKKRLKFCNCCGAGVMPYHTDRVIMRNRFAYYHANGSVDRIETAQNEHRIRVNGFAGFDSSINPALNETHCEALAGQIAEMKFKLFIAAGLQSLFQPVRKTTEKELERFVGQGTKIHFEISGTGNFEWLINNNIIPQYIYSVGIGEELTSLFDMINIKKFEATSTPIERFTEEKRQDKLSISLQNKPTGYQQVMRALEVAHSLQLKRLYVHLLDMDIIIREGDLSQSERLKEIEAGLVAKWVVLRKLMSMGVISLDQSRDTMTQVKEEGFAALLETAQAIYEDLNSPPSGAIELNGIYFEKKYNRTVILIPVRWVYGSMQDQLRIVGAGDTTSTISAVQAILNN